MLPFLQFAHDVMSKNYAPPILFLQPSRTKKEDIRWLYLVFTFVLGIIYVPGLSRFFEYPNLGESGVIGQW